MRNILIRSVFSFGFSLLAQGALAAPPSIDDLATFSPTAHSLSATSQAPKFHAQNASVSAELKEAAGFGQVLGQVDRDKGETTRGATEARVYRVASPSVVLIATKEALGSGALIGPKGMIVTNLHVVGDNDRVGVIFKPLREGQQITKADLVIGRVIRRDAVADLALVVVDEVPVYSKPLVFGEVSALHIGDDVHAIGHPTGETWTYTRGIVSQIRRSYQWTAEDKISHQATVVQTQTPINPGNSGGPLLDNSARLIGINSFKGEGEGLNFAVSVEDIRGLLKRASDRSAPTAQPVASTENTSTECKAKSLETWRDEEKHGTYTSVDGNCSGKITFYMFEPDDKTQPFYAIFKDEATGKVSVILVSNNRDGNIDEGYYDTVGDGKFHVHGFFNKGETKPYRYENIG